MHQASPNQGRASQFAVALVWCYWFGCVFNPHQRGLSPFAMEVKHRCRRIRTKESSTSVQLLVGLKMVVVVDLTFNLDAHWGCVRFSYLNRSRCRCLVLCFLVDFFLSLRIGFSSTKLSTSEWYLNPQEKSFFIWYSWTQWTSSLILLNPSKIPLVWGGWMFEP